MDYFAVFPSLQYTFDPNSREFFTLKNIFTRVSAISEVLQNSLVYYQYAMKDTDTLETIAYKYYGDPKRHWIIILANVIIDPYFDLPLKAEDLDNNIIKKYGSLANAQSQIACYNQTTVVNTLQNQTSNTQTYNVTVTACPFSYDFRLKQMVPSILPDINNPILTTSNTTVVTPDGSIVNTVTTVTAVTSYDNEVSINEAKRNIVLIDSNYASQIESQFQSLLV